MRYIDRGREREREREEGEQIYTRSLSPSLAGGGETWTPNQRVELARLEWGAAERISVDGSGRTHEAAGGEREREREGD